MKYIRLPPVKGIIWRSMLAFFVDIFMLANCKAETIKAHAERHTFWYHIALLSLLYNPDDKKALQDVARTRHRLIIMMDFLTTYAPHKRSEFPRILEKLYDFRDIEIKTGVEPLQ